MKKLYALLMFVSASLFAQPQINEPSPILVCDIGLDGFEVVDLTVRNDEILGGLSTDDHSFSFHLTQAEAENFENLLDPINFTMNGNFVAYVRVVHIDAPDLASIVALEVVWQQTIEGMVLGGGTYCLNENLIATFSATGGVAPYTFTYNINGGAMQTIVSNGPGNQAMVSIAGTAVGTFVVNLMSVSDSIGNECSIVLTEGAVFEVITGPTVVISGPNAVCQFSEASLTITFSGGAGPYGAIIGINGMTIYNVTSDSNVVTIPINTAATGSYFYQVYEPSSNGCILPEFFQHQVVVNPLPALTPAPDLIVEDDTPFDGVAGFDFGSQSDWYIQSNPGAVVTFHINEESAAGGFNSVFSPYMNISNPQPIWARVESSSGCFVLDMFYLIVTPPDTDAIFIPDTNLKAALVAANPSVNTAMNAQNENITVDTNGDGEIQISEANQVATMNVNALGINSMEGIKYFYNLEFLYCQDNSITALDISGMPWLVYVQAMNNQTMQTVNVAGNTGLESLYVQTASLTTLDVSSCTNLAVLACFQNDLTDLNVQGLQNLAMLNCDFNELTSLNVSTTPNLTDLSCSFNQITSLDLSNLAGLTALQASVNQLTTIDVSENHNLNYLNVEANLLETAFIKNGASEEFLFGGNDNLTYICADLIQFEDIQNNVNFNENIALTPYCSDEPGGSFNTIFGTVRFDANNNGCDDDDLAQPFTKVGIFDGTTQGFVFISSGLTYEFHTGQGTFTVSPDLENSTLFNVFPNTGIVSFPDTNDNISINNFCLTANGINPDVEVVIAPLGVARPGFDAHYKIVIRNKGNQINSGQVTFNYNDALAGFVSSVPSPSGTAPGQLTFGYLDLAPFENREMVVTLNVNAPTDVPAVNIGDVLDFIAAVTLNGDDILPDDNSFGFDQTVVGAYDPNDKQCLEGNVVAPTQIGKFLHYVINFENTGNFPAENVVVRDVIDTEKFDLSSLQILNTSHPVMARVTGNNVEFYFKNINLGIGGHGNILLKIRTLETLAEGDIVTNKADIFFDYNYPIETNVASTAFQALSTPDFASHGLVVYPNPSQGLFTVEAADEIQLIEIFDISGRLLQATRPAAGSVLLDLTHRRAGIYFLKIRTSHGTAMRKIVNR